MERTGIMSGKENVEQQENVKMSEHAAKVRAARDARRKRILARSSERLAFITGEANAIPTSPLLDNTNSLSAILNQEVTHYNSPDQESTIKLKKSLFNEYEGGKQSEAQKKLVKHRDNTSNAGATIVQPSKIAETMEGSYVQQAHESMNENPITFNSKLSNCIKQSLCPRLICAIWIALAFLASGFTQGARLDTLSIIFYSPSASGSRQSSHLGCPDILSMIGYSLASVMLVDLFLFMGALFFFPGLKLMRNSKAMANKSTLSSIVLHLFLSISLDCSVSASLLFGGYLVLSKYFPSHISGVA